MTRFCANSMIAGAIVVAAGILILVCSSAFHEGASTPVGWESGSAYVSAGPLGTSASGDGVSAHSDTEEEVGEEGVEDSTPDFVALGVVLFLLPLASRLLCALYEALRPS